MARLKPISPIDESPFDSGSMRVNGAYIVGTAAVAAGVIIGSATQNPALLFLSGAVAFPMTVVGHAKEMQTMDLNAKARFEEWSVN